MFKFNVGRLRTFTLPKEQSMKFPVLWLSFVRVGGYREVIYLAWDRGPFVYHLAHLCKTGQRQVQREKNKINAD